MRQTDGIVRKGNVMYGSYRSGFGGNVIGANGVSFALSTMSGGMREPMILIVYESE